MQETRDTSRALHFQGCRDNKDAAGNQLCSLWFPFCQTDGAQIMKWLLRRDYIASYSLDRFAAGPWNQSSQLSREEKLIPVKAQMPKPVERFVVGGAQTPNSATKKGTIYCNPVQRFQWCFSGGAWNKALLACQRGCWLTGKKNRLKINK